MASLAPKVALAEELSLIAHSLAGAMLTARVK